MSDPVIKDGWWWAWRKDVPLGIRGVTADPEIIKVSGNSAWRCVGKESNWTRCDKRPLDSFDLVQKCTRTERTRNSAHHLYAFLSEQYRLDRPLPKCGPGSE